MKVTDTSDVWWKTAKKQQPTVFPGEETSVWELDERSGQYFQHVFYKHQPDLNIANPRVRDEIAKTIGFWLALGVSAHEFLRDLKSFLQRRAGDAALLAQPALHTAAGLLRRRARRRTRLAVRFHLDAGVVSLAGTQ